MTTRTKAWIGGGALIVSLAGGYWGWTTYQDRLAAVREAARLEAVREAQAKIDEAQQHQVRADEAEQRALDKEKEIAGIREQLAGLASELARTRKHYASLFDSVLRDPNVDPGVERRKLCAELKAWGATRGITVDCQP